MLSHFMYRNHLCIVFELLGQNLYEFLKSHEPAGLSLPLVKHFARQILTSLAFLHKEKVNHCDLKPEKYETLY